MNGGQEEFGIAVIVEVGEDAGAAIGDGIDAGDPGDILEFLAVATEEEGVALIPAEGKALVEDQVVLIVVECTGFLLRIVLHHDRTPSPLTLEVLRRLARRVYSRSGVGELHRGRQEHEGRRPDPVDMGMAESIRHGVIHGLHRGGPLYWNYSSFAASLIYFISKRTLD